MNRIPFSDATPPLCSIENTTVREKGVDPTSCKINTVRFVDHRFCVSEPGYQSDADFLIRRLHGKEKTINLMRLPFRKIENYAVVPFGFCLPFPRLCWSLRDLGLTVRKKTALDGAAAVTLLPGDFVLVAPSPLDEGAFVLRLYAYGPQTGSDPGIATFDTTMVFKRSEMQDAINDGYTAAHEARGILSPSKSRLGRLVRLIHALRVGFEPCVPS